MNRRRRGQDLIAPPSISLSANFAPVAMTARHKAIDRRVPDVHGKVLSEILTAPRLSSRPLREGE